MSLKSRTPLANFALWIGDMLLWLCVLIGFLWAFGAIWFFALLPEAVRIPLAVLYLAAGVFLIRRTFRKGSPADETDIDQSWRRWVRPGLAASIVATYLLMALLVRPSNERKWSADQDRLPVVTIDGNQVTIEHFRDFRYDTPTDFQTNYRTVSFQFDQLESVWLIVQRFTRFHGMAHTFLSFGLDTPEGKKYFSVSVEIRREDGELYSPLAGLYRHYELMYVVGSEQDLIGVRTNIRPDDRLYLFPVNVDREQVQQLFLKFVDRIESLRGNPEFYNTLTSNCTNNIVANTRELAKDPISTFNPRIVLPGYSDKLAYDQALIGKPQQPFEEVREQCRIDELARESGITDRFSVDIRRNTAK